MAASLKARDRANEIYRAVANDEKFFRSGLTLSVSANHVTLLGNKGLQFTTELLLSQIAYRATRIVKYTVAQQQRTLSDGSSYSRVEVSF